MAVLGMGVGPLKVPTGPSETLKDDKTDLRLEKGSQGARKLLARGSLPVLRLQKETASPKAVLFSWRKSPCWFIADA